MSVPSRQSPLASRGGLKLQAALDAFQISVRTLIAADLGSSTGGFVDVLLRRGARKVYAVEKGFGRLAWSLRNDPRVTVLERQDATTILLPELVNLITIDIGFTRQHQVLPHAVSLLRPAGRIVSLLKPQYEASGRELIKGRVTDELAHRIARRVIADLRRLDINVTLYIPSPVRGKDANALEFFLLISGTDPDCLEPSARIC